MMRCSTLRASTLTPCCWARAAPDSDRMLRECPPHRHGSPGQALHRLMGVNDAVQHPAGLNPDTVLLGASSAGFRSDAARMPAAPPRLTRSGAAPSDGG